MKNIKFYLNAILLSASALSTPHAMENDTMDIDGNSSSYDQDTKRVSKRPREESEDLEDMPPLKTLKNEAGEAVLVKSKEVLIDEMLVDQTEQELKAEEDLVFRIYNGADVQLFKEDPLKIPNIKIKAHNHLEYIYLLIKLNVLNHKDQTNSLSFQEAIDHVKALAQQNNSKAQNILGGMYDHGQGVSEDPMEAVQWYRKAAEQGHAQAQFNLAGYYMQGRGVPKNETETFQWCRKAAEQGHANAQFNLADCYMQGFGVPKNETEAVKWYRKAAEQGHAQAQFILTNCYAHGRGVPKNEAEAFQWGTKAAEQGLAQAQNMLGNMYYNGSGVPKDEKEALKWYTKAAEQGLAQAQNSLGVLYAKGIGVPKNETEAVKWYTKAAEQGLVQAQNWLGFYYAQGQGVPKDEKEAIKWYRMAAEQGHAQAQNSLGVLYTNGIGVPKNETEAVKWYRKAAEQGVSYSYNNLASLIYKNLNSQNVFKKQKIFETSQWIINQTSQLLKDASIPDQNSQSLREARVYALMALNAAYSQGWKEDEFTVEKNDLKGFEYAFEASLNRDGNNNILDVINYFKNRDFYVLPTADISVDLMNLKDNLAGLDGDYIANTNYGLEKHKFNDPTKVQPLDAEKPYFKLVPYFEERYKFLHETVSPLIEALGTINTLKSHPYLIKIDTIKPELYSILSNSENKFAWVKTYNNQQYLSFGENEVKNAHVFFETLEKFDETLEDIQKTLKTLYKIEKGYLKTNQLKLRNMAELNPNSINLDLIKEESEKCNRSERIKANLKAAKNIFKNWSSTRDELLYVSHNQFLQNYPWWKTNIKTNK